MKVIHGDCIEAMAGMAENSVDSIVCDPPYELTSIVKRFGKEGSAPAKHGTDGRFTRLGKGFMGKEWDGTGIGLRPEVWRECLRIAKPGAYLLAFGGTRTFHRLACAIEDAGWTLRDTLSWNYGSGFPKSKNVALAIDKGEGHPNRGRAIPTASHLQNASDKHLESNPVPDYEAKSEAAKQWNGFGTALKPAWEPMLLFQKPLEGTYAENVLKWGCGALNIDGCRIGNDKVQINKLEKWSGFGQEKRPDYTPTQSQGRWPANFLLSHTIFCEKVGEREAKAPDRNTWDKGASYFDGAGHQKEKSYTKGGGGKEMVDVYQCVPDCPVRMLDEQSGERTGCKPHHVRASEMTAEAGRRSGWGNMNAADRFAGYDDQGGASRFFYCAKVSREERNAGLEAVHTLFEKRGGFGETITDDGREKPIDNHYLRGETMRSNNHPTVKPIALMRYLCRLVTPPRGTVLDLFAGSGSTGCAAVLEGFQFIGIEKEKEYAEIARARIEHWSKGEAPTCSECGRRGKERGPLCQ